MRIINIMILVLLCLSTALLGQTGKENYRLGFGKITLKRNGKYYFLKKVGTEASSSGKYHKSDSVIILNSRYDKDSLRHVKYRGKLFNKSDSITFRGYLKGFKGTYFGVGFEVYYKDGSTQKKDQFQKDAKFIKRDITGFKVLFVNAQSQFFELKNIKDEIKVRIKYPERPGYYNFFKDSEFVIRNDTLVPIVQSNIDIR